MSCHLPPELQDMWKDIIKLIVGTGEIAVPRRIHPDNMVDYKWKLLAYFDGSDGAFVCFLCMVSGRLDQILVRVD